MLPFFVLLTSMLALKAIASAAASCLAALLIAIFPANVRAAPEKPVGWRQSRDAFAGEIGYIVTGRSETKIDSPVLRNL